MRSIRAAAYAAATFACQAHAQIFLIAELQPPQLQSGSGFGSSMLDMQSAMAVSAPAMNMDAIAEVGAVYMFDRLAPNAAPVELRPQQIIAHSAFGTSIDGPSNAIVIGAPGGSAMPNDTAPPGVAEGWNFVYDWSRYGTISPPAGYAGTEFARSVSYSNQTLVVGFPGRIDNGVAAGAVLTFYEAAGNWDYAGSFSLPLNGFGEKVYSEGSNTLATDPVSNTVYYLLGMQGTGTLPEPQQNEGELVSFGKQLWANGYVLVGTPYPLDYNGAPLPGRVYAYRRGVDGYELFGTILAPDAAPGDGFGASIDSFGGWFAIGAPTAPVADIPAAGSVWLFDHIGTLYPKRLVSTRPQPEGHFGAALSWRYGSLGIGAPGEAVRGVPRAGAAYVFASDPDVIFKGSFDYL